MARHDSIAPLSNPPARRPKPRPLRARQRLGKYRIARRIAQGGFADVYAAQDTIEGVRVALKIPQAGLMDQQALDDFTREVRITTRLDHPNILPIKNAEFIDGRFVITYPLGERSLDDRMRRRIPAATLLDYVEQMLEAVAHAHERRIIHCDIKPENFILFPGDRLRLADFGIAKVARRTMRVTGSGTLGYLAPEQAMGRPSLRSDVFALGLVIYSMISGHLPQWPFEWPPPGFDRVRNHYSPGFIALLRRALTVEDRKRHRDAGQMLAAFRRVKSRAARATGRANRRSKRATDRTPRDWRQIRIREFQRRFGKALETRGACAKCEGPVSQWMIACPWCSAAIRKWTGPVKFPVQCRRCARGMKSDWTYCASCYGKGYEPHSTREFSDARYEARCANPRCARKSLMPFMRYCPWCRMKVRRKWKAPESREKCKRCGWGVVGEFWEFCPWCAKTLRPSRSPRR